MIDEVIYVNQTDINKYESVSNAIDYAWLETELRKVQSNYIDKILGDALANELKRLIYIDMIKPNITASIASNVLTVTNHSGALIAVGDEITAQAKLRAIEKLKPLKYKLEPTAEDLTKIAALEAEITLYPKNNTKIKTFLTGVGGVGTYEIEIEGNATVNQTLASKDLELINDNVRLISKIANPLITFAIMNSFSTLSMRLTAQGLIKNTSDKFEVIELEGITYRKGELRTQGNIALENLQKFLEINYLIYPLYVRKDNCNNNFQQSIYFY